MEGWRDAEGSHLLPSQLPFVTLSTPQPEQGNAQ